MSAITEALLSIVTDAGYLPVVEDADVVFRVEGNRYVWERFDGDDCYARLRTSFVLPEGVSRQRLVTHANTRNVEAKAVKTTVLWKYGQIVFSVESFFDEPDHVRQTFDRMLAAIRIASDNYYEGVIRKTAAK